MSDIIEFVDGTLATYNGEITILNTETGGHRTFSVKTQADDARFAPGQRIIALLTGSNNESDYTGFGFVTADKIKVWGKKQSQPWLAYARMLEKPSCYPTCEYKMAIRCRKCNRKLTDPVSIEYGMGPICRGE